jgi:uncharacterized cupin superfamily protein
MRRVNIAEPEFVFDDDDPPGFRAGMMRFGKDLGAEETGASVYVLPPGEALCPYHYEHGEEEWVLVLDGHPSVRTPDGVERLEPMDVVFFPRGPAGAHQLRNDDSDPARVLMWSTIVLPTVSVYPDSGKVGVWTASKADDGLFVQSSAVPYFTGETNEGG